MNTVEQNLQNYFKTGQNFPKYFETLNRVFPGLVIEDWSELDFYNESTEGSILEYTLFQLMGNFSCDYYSIDKKQIELFVEYDDPTVEDLNIVKNNLSKYGWTISNYEECVKEINDILNERY